MLFCKHQGYNRVSNLHSGFGCLASGVEKVTGSNIK
jgi:hypothetical protein